MVHGCTRHQLGPHTKKPSQKGNHGLLTLNMFADVIAHPFVLLLETLLNFRWPREFCKIKLSNVPNVWYWTDFLVNISGLFRKTYPIEIKRTTRRLFRHSHVHDGDHHLKSSITDA